MEKKKKQPKTLKEKKLLRTPFDMALILDVLFLNIFGIIMIYSASYYYAEHALGKPPYYYMMSQALYLAAGLVGMVIIGFVRPRFWRRFRIPLLCLLASFFLVICMKVPGLRHGSHGAYRWFKIPGLPAFQIAEPLNLMMIVFMAWAITKFRITNKIVFFGLFGIFGFLALLLLVFSNNLSTAIVIMMMLFFTLMVNYPRQKWFGIVLAGGLLLAFLAVLYIDKFTTYDVAENFRITRIRAWLHPTDPEYIDDQAYQATQALYAIASGGFFGKGLGRSLIKFVLPEPHNDYILAIIFEELGVCGVLILTMLFIYLLYRIFLIWRDSKKKFSKGLCIGVFFHIASQVLINYAVTLGIIPTTGVTLTFISSGGTAVMFTLLELGFVLAVDRENKERKLYEEAEKAVKKTLVKREEGSYAGPEPGIL